MSQTPLTIGAAISERYSVEAVLGTGGMANVYRVRDRTDNALLALKLLNRDQRTSTSGPLRFRQDFEILQAIQHANVVKAGEYGTTPDGDPFYTMEEIPGRSLSELLKAGQVLPLPIALDILEQLARVMSFIHAHEIVYCDLKPSNVIVVSDQPAAIKLIDFGIARRLSDREDSPGNVSGSSLYMSPEQVRGDFPDTRSDIYSFGATAFETLTCRVPFPQEGFFGVTASHLIGKVPSLKEMRDDAPAALDRMIQVCLSKDPADRYQSFAEIIERIMNLKAKSDMRPWWKKVLGIADRPRTSPA